MEGTIRNSCRVYKLLQVDHRTVVIGVLLTGTFATAEPAGVRIPLQRRSWSLPRHSSPKTQARRSRYSTHILPGTEYAIFSPLQNGLYLGNITIGQNPQQNLTVVLDSGSSDLWVFSTVAHEVVNNIWVPTINRDGTDLHTNSTIGYGNGVVVTYEAWNESVTIGGISVKNTTIGAADIAQNNFTPAEVAAQGYSGILGLGWPADNSGGFTPFLEQAFSEGLISANLFGFFAGKEDNSTQSELTLGYIDPSKYTGALQYHATEADLAGDFVAFTFNVTSTKIGNSTYDYNNGTNQIFFADTGNSFLALSDPFLTAVVNSVNGTLISPSLSSGGYEIPCENVATAPTIHIGIDGIDYPIPGSVWARNDPTLVQAGVQCFAELYESPYPATSGVGGNLGDTFWRQYFAAFDFTNHSIGLGLSINA